MIVIVGIGADGWPGLGEPAREALRAAPTVIGSERQLALLPADVPGERRPWPSPIDPLVDEVAAGRHDGAAVLACGDPMLHGIGSSLARRGVALAVHPHASAFAYACARLGWPEADVGVVNIVGRSPDALARVLQPRRRVVVFGTAASAAAVLVDRGYGPSRFVVLEQLGGPSERFTESTADSWGDRPVDPLHAVAIECVAADGTPLLPGVPGLPDEAYDTDGALTKRPCAQPRWRRWPRSRARCCGTSARAAARSASSGCGPSPPPAPSRSRSATTGPSASSATPGSSACRTSSSYEAGRPTRSRPSTRPTPSSSAAAWPRRACSTRAGRRCAPAAASSPTRSRSRASVVVAQARAQRGGTLTRIELSHAEPLGGFTGWRAQRPVVQWAVTKP